MRAPIRCGQNLSLSREKPMSRTTIERAKRQSIVDACRQMNQLGINQGTSGNISLRHENGMLITPENFQSVETLERLVAGQLAAAKAA